MNGVIKNICYHESCQLQPEFGYSGQLYPISCQKHAPLEMVHFISKDNRRPSIVSKPTMLILTTKMDERKTNCEACGARAFFNYKGAAFPRYCRYHAGKNMVDLRIKRCAFTTCPKQPCFNFPGHNTALYCLKHSSFGMVNVKAQRCAHVQCEKIPSFNFPGTSPALYCSNHQKKGMINLKHPRPQDQAAVALLSLQ